MIALSVNLNKIALLRNSRDLNFPSVEEFGQRALDLGAAGLTVHPRPDQRHIRPSDVYTISELCAKPNYVQAGIEFNIEGNPFAPENQDYPGFLSLIKQSKPHQCTLVPDSNDQKTSDHGFDLLADTQALESVIAEIQSLGIRVSLFMDPDLPQIEKAKQIGADRIEFYTGPFAQAFSNNPKNAQVVFERYGKAAQLALELGLGINAGHDLNLQNMTLFKTLPGLKEVSIGHALTVDALNMGFDRAIQAYLDICS